MTDRISKLEQRVSELEVFVHKYIFAPTGNPTPDKETQEWMNASLGEPVNGVCPKCRLVYCECKYPQGERTLEEKVRTKVYMLTSDMLDNPDDCGIYPTTDFYNRMTAYIISLIRQSDKGKVKTTTPSSLDEELYGQEFCDHEKAGRMMCHACRKVFHDPYTVMIDRKVAEAVKILRSTCGGSVSANKMIKAIDSALGILLEVKNG